MSKTVLKVVMFSLLTISLSFAKDMFETSCELKTPLNLGTSNLLYPPIKGIQLPALEVKEMLVTIAGQSQPLVTSGYIVFSNFKFNGKNSKALGINYLKDKNQISSIGIAPNVNGKGTLTKTNLLQPDENHNYTILKHHTKITTINRIGDEVEYFTGVAVIKDNHLIALEFAEITRNDQYKEACLIEAKASDFKANVEHTSYLHTYY